MHEDPAPSQPSTSGGKQTDHTTLAPDMSDEVELLPNPSTVDPNDQLEDGEADGASEEEAVDDGKANSGDEETDEPEPLGEQPNPGRGTATRRFQTQNDITGAIEKLIQLNMRGLIDDRQLSTLVRALKALSDLLPKSSNRPTLQTAPQFIMDGVVNNPEELQDLHAFFTDDQLGSITKGHLAEGRHHDYEDQAI